MINKTWDGVKTLWQGAVGVGYSWLVIIGFILLTYGNKKEIDEIDWKEWVDNLE